MLNAGEKLSYPVLFDAHEVGKHRMRFSLTISRFEEITWKGSRKGPGSMGHTDCIFEIIEASKGQAVENLSTYFFIFCLPMCHRSPIMVFEVFSRLGLER